MQHRFHPRRRDALVLIAAAAAARPALAQLKSGDDPEASPRWQQVRKALFAGRRIDGAAGVLTLEAPARAEDAAIVPVAIKAAFPQTPARSIARLWLVIDNNPSPIAGSFEFTQASGRADLETRVRVDEYTFVRAIAETNDGRLHMAAKWVKASGGCSAPPGKDPQAALATLGQMKFRVDGTPAEHRPLLAQLMISHPNHSGLAMDQLTRQYTPAHFVRQVSISYAGRPVLSADVDFSLSENPNLRFWFVPDGPGELRAEVVDSQDRKFEGALRLGES